MNDLINRIDELCAERKWTYNELGKQSDISANVLYKWRAGAKPSVPNLEKVCEGFGISLKQFFNGVNSTELSEQQNKILGDWVLLKKNQKELIMSMIEFFVKENFESNLMNSQKKKMKVFQRTLSGEIESMCKMAITIYQIIYLDIQLTLTKNLLLLKNKPIG